MLMRIATYFAWRALRPFVLIGGAGLVIGGGLKAQNGPEPLLVFVGGEAGLDACASTGQVSGLKPTAGNFLALRNRPDTDGKLLQKLAVDTPLILCSQNGDWYGVVLPQSGVDCGVSSPIALRQPYRGPCRSGWVFGKYVEGLAG